MQERNKTGCNAVTNSSMVICEEPEILEFYYCGICAERLKTFWMGGEKGMRYGRRRMSIDRIIQEALENAPTIQGYTIKHLSEATGDYWILPRWHIESLKAKGIIDPFS